MAGNYLIDGGSHVDGPLSNIAVKAFQGMPGMVAPQLFPSLSVEKQTDGYYVIDPDSWLRIPDTNRAPRAPVNRSEWKVSTDVYFCKNYAHGTDHAKETLSNADAAIRIRENSTMFVLEMLARDKELRIANLVSSVSNVGSGHTVSSVWSGAGSNPVADTNIAHQFIEDKTGLHANTMLMDKDTYRNVRHNVTLREYFKYTGAGPMPDQLLKDLFEVDNLLIARGIVNRAKEGQTASLTNIWGNLAILAVVRPANGAQTATAGLSFEWRPEGFPGMMAVERYDHETRSRKIENIDAQYFGDEKIIARDLIYTIKGTL